MPVPPIVLDSVTTFLALADSELPVSIEGLYLEGSVALDDFQPDASDIDFVAVTSRPLDAEATAALAAIHTRLRQLRKRPFFDGIYLTWGDLAAGADAAVCGPVSLEGVLRVNAAAGKGNPVTWQTLADHGVVLRGPAIGDFDLRTDPAVLAARQNANLDEYWAAGLDRADRLFSARGAGLLADYGTVWTVTGIARLHHTIATGGITSKSGAAEYITRAFPDRWHRVAAEALRLRRGNSARSLYRNRPARRRDVLEFGRMAVADAHRIYAELSADSG
ncbi:aminoglycoside adenylyltransferase domain-containing protein [Nocardia sp. NPDC005978]|uniref:aminoglycoside adenylyltransferase domain-containing protein n=1 Tax=Nocardia sp. NPDC005978 TaxID=3156725 RepID=UPI0033B48EDF